MRGIVARKLRRLAKEYAPKPGRERVLYQKLKKEHKSGS